MAEIVEPLAEDLGLKLVIVGLGGLLLGILGYILGKAIQYLIGWIPAVGPAVAQGVEDAIVNPSLDLFHSSESKLTRGFKKIEYLLGVAGGLTLLGIAGVANAFGALWHTYIPNFVHAITKPIDKLANEAKTLAQTAEKDAQKALHKAESIVIPDANALWKAVETHVGAAVATGVADAEKYADQAVAALRTAETTAIANATTLAQTAEHDAAAALTQAEAYAGSLVAPVGADLTALENYIKGLNLAALVAAVPVLSALLTQVLTDTGLSNSDCRSKVKDVCATNPAAWESMLGLLGVIGFSFSLEELANDAKPVVGTLTDVIRQAA